MVAALNACSSKPTSWEQRGSAEAPATVTYKADLDMPADSGSEVELSYETESVESYAPETAVETDSVGGAAVIAIEEEPVTEWPSIMDHPASYYTMQLIASKDIDSIYRFADQNQVSSQYIVPTVRDGVTWHVLLLDVYPDRQSAVAARDEIAPRLKNEPWIRSVGSVQKLVQ